MNTNKKIVVIGGGTGVYTVLTALKPHFNDLTAIVTMADDGGSTGILREEFGILPPGDIRRALVALADADNKVLSDLFSYRFKEGGGLVGHSFGNLLIAALERLTGSFEKAVQEAGKILKISGKVIPVTFKKTRLAAELENGQVIVGENNIDIPSHDGRLSIKRIYLKPAAAINPKARQAILEADLVIIGPGDLYTSIIPNLAVKGVGTALKKTKGKIVYVVNLMTKFGETNNFAASDFIRAIKSYLGFYPDFVIVNNKRPVFSRLRNYTRQYSEFVVPDIIGKKNDFIAVAADLIRSRGFIRHDPGKLAKVIKMIL